MNDLAGRTDLIGWQCATCAVEYPDSIDPPANCPICDDDRQYVRPTGQRWTHRAELAVGRRAELVEVEPGLYGVDVKPSVGIGQRALLVRTDGGNLLWDPTGYFDDAVLTEIAAVGGIAAVAASHPHMFGIQTAWAAAAGADVPIWVCADDAEWVQRPDPRIRTWREPTEVLPGVTLHRIGGHFPGSAVAHFTGADGQGVLLTGDTVAGTPDEHWVSFLRSYPNKVPLSAAVVTVVAERVLALDFDRLYDNFAGAVRADAHGWVRRSADRYVGWVRGDFDHLTGT